MTLDPRSDAELLAAASRDASAFRTLYDRHVEAVHAFARRRTGDDDVALDLTAETFARAWYARRRFRDDRSGQALPWLYGIAANVVRESVRRRRLALAAVQRLGVLSVADPATAPDPSWVTDLDADLQAALEQLSDAQRHAVIGRVIADQSYEDLSEALACTPAAARVRVTRGLARIRRTLEEERHDR
jgi:RNA polymerase sigma-70 factor (ECF subfamily)